jgi:hypothetical protein
VAKIRLLRQSVGRLRNAAHDYRIVRKWERTGRRLPVPSQAKRAYLRTIARQYRLRVFIETGTYDGGTLAALRRSFKQLHSIELSPEFYEQARIRFAADKRISIWQGDSGVVLREVLDKIHEPVLFWLDGHYSGGSTACGAESTPIRRELAHIADHAHLGQHVVVIDDARLFCGTNGYPSIAEAKMLAGTLGFKTFRRVDDFLFLR